MSETLAPQARRRSSGRTIRAEPERRAEQLRDGDGRNWAETRDGHLGWLGERFIHILIR
jgi:hypothetical protein